MKSLSVTRLSHNRPGWLCVSLFTLLVTCTAGRVAAEDQNEPTYQGRSLSEWTDDLGTLGRAGVRGPEPQASIAIRHMGTNAIPILLKWMSEPDPSEVTKTNVSPWFNTSRSQRAAMAFGILGETARPAIPELTRLAGTSSDPKRVERCANCLAGIGPEAVASLLSLATNGPPLASWHAFHALYDFEGTPLAKALVPVLIKCLDDQREEVASEAASLLAGYNLPDVVVPALTNALQSSSALTRSLAVQCLGFHDDEKVVSAIPLLRAVMRDPDYAVRESATNVLRSMGGWQLDRNGRWFRLRGTNTLHGITPDFFGDVR